MVASLWLTTSPVARAADSGKERCARASERAQDLRIARRLREAFTVLVSCARSTCPAVVRADCASWLSDVERALPTVVISARDVNGEDVLNVRVYLNGALLTDGVDGKSIAVDPGTYVIRYEMAGRAAVESDVVIREGEKNRILAVTFARPTEEQPIVGAPTSDANSAVAPARGVPGAPLGAGVGDRAAPVVNELSPALPASEASVPAEVPRRGGAIGWAPVALGLFGLASTGTAAALFVSTKNEVDDLRGTCAPRCAEADVSALRTRLTASHVALGVGLASLAGAALVFTLRSPGRPPSKARFTASARPSPWGMGIELARSF